MKRTGIAWTCCLVGWWAAVGPGPPCGGAEIEDLGVAVRAVVFGNSQGCLAESPSGTRDTPSWLVSRSQRVT